MTITDETRKQLLVYQKNEITEHHIYSRLAASMKDTGNRQILEQISADELRHYHSWKEYTGQDVARDRLKVGWFYWIARILGFTFAIKLMEKSEESAQENYGELTATIDEAEAIAKDENDHEAALIEMLDEERLRYVGSIVLGLNDALVELTGALAGLTLALQDTKLIALTGSITGIAAALSMGASEYVSTQTEDTDRDPLKAAVYTSSAYIVAVVILMLPYLLLDNYYICLICTLAAAVGIIALFNYYTSVAQDSPFTRRFLQMTALSLGVAAVSFVIGLLIRNVLGVEI